MIHYAAPRLFVATTFVATFFAMGCTQPTPPPGESRAEQFLEQHYQTDKDLSLAKLAAYEWALTEHFSHRTSENAEARPLVICELDWLDKALLGKLTTQFPFLIPIEKYIPGSEPPMLIDADIAMVDAPLVAVIVTIDRGPNQRQSIYLTLRYIDNHWQVLSHEQLEIT